MPEEPKPTIQAGNASRKEELPSLAGAVWDLYKSKSFWRQILIISAANLAIFFLLGLWVYVIIFGVFMVLVRLAAVSLPARRVMTAITGLVGKKTVFVEFTGSAWSKTRFLFPALFWLGVAALGFWLLFTNGFLEQNLLHLLFSK
jgi:hypothetical protein